MSNPIASMREKCPHCGKNAVEISRKQMTAARKILIKLACGHTLMRSNMELADEGILCDSNDGKSPYPYQYKSCRFFEKAELNGICAHEMGVGKMVIGAMLLKRNAKVIKKRLWVTKAGLKYQTWHEVVRWTGIVPQIIESSRDLPLFEYFDTFIISYDTLRLVRPDISREWEEMNAAGLAQMTSIRGRRQKGAEPIRWTDEICSKFDFIVMDECQQIKNPDASRTRAIKKIASAWQRIAGAKRPKVMGLSGTPIQNDASEYGTILHMVNPTLFPSETGFIARDCIQVGNGNRYRLRNPAAFHEKTKDFILRYTRADVLPELPPVSRMFQYAEIEEGDVLTKYQAVVQEFMDFLGDKEKVGMGDITNILGFFSRMRRLTGVAKVQAALDFCEEFLLSTERKLVVFVHHHETASTLFAALEKLCRDGAMDPPLMAMPPFDARRRQEIVNEFKGITTERHVAEDGSLSFTEVPTGMNHRIMIASTQAVGEGFNLQFASDCLIMERQWNPSKEEQAEGRFPRPGSTADKINATYLVAAGTIDDFLTELVERKRSIVSSTLDNKETNWDESSLMVELAQILQVKGLRKWQV